MGKVTLIADTYYKPGCYFIKISPAVRGKTSKKYAVSIAGLRLMVFSVIDSIWDSIISRFPIIGDLWLQSKKDGGVQCQGWAGGGLFGSPANILFL